MRIRGALATAVLSVLSAVTLVASGPAAHASTGTTVRAKVVTGSGLGFDAADTQRPSFERAWTASPYRTVNIYFSGRYRYHTSQPELTADWVTTVLSNGWSLIPTVVDLQAPCATSSAKAKIPQNTSTSRAWGLGAQVAAQAHSDLAALGLAGTVAYLDLEPFDVTKSSTCASIVRAYIHGWVAKLHSSGDKAGVYFNWRLGGPTIAAMYGTANAPDDVWVAQYNGVASAATSVIGTKWPHHRLHQYVGNATETYAGLGLNIDRDAIDGAVVAAASVSTPTGPYTYNVNGYYDSTHSVGDTLNIRTQPSTSAPTLPTPLNAGDAIDIACQATGETVNGDYVWDKLNTADPEYVSDLYTTTTGRNGLSSAIPRCDTTPPTLSVTSLPQVTVGPSATLRWSAADAPDPDGNPNQERRGIASTTVLYRYATWRNGFTTWRPFTTTAANSVNVPLALGYAYCFVVQTHDLSGNTTSAPSTCTARPLDDRQLTTTTSGWTRKTGSSYFRGTFTRTTAASRVLTLSSVRARYLGVVAATCTTCGAVRVYIGSSYVGTVNLRANATYYRRLFMLPAFSLRSGTVKLVTTSKRLVRIDGLVASRV